MFLIHGIIERETPFCPLSLFRYCDTHNFIDRCDTESATRRNHYCCSRYVSHPSPNFQFSYIRIGTNKRQIPSQDSGAAYLPELQSARCMSNRYRTEEFPRCISCTRRWAGDMCRFQGIRYFMRDADKKLVGISFSESHSAAQIPKMAFPSPWNRKVEREHVRRLKVRPSIPAYGQF